LLTVYSYLFHLLLSIFLLGAASISAASRQPLNLRMLPFTQETMLSGVLVLGAIGLVATMLAMLRIFRYLFPVWAAIVLYFMVRGFLFSTYAFSDKKGFESALWLIVGALAAFIGSLWALKRRRRWRIF
jgi:hypothetical protein